MSPPFQEISLKNLLMLSHHRFALMPSTQYLNVVCVLCLTKCCILNAVGVSVLCLNVVCALISSVMCFEYRLYFALILSLLYIFKGCLCLCFV